MSTDLARGVGHLAPTCAFVPVAGGIAKGAYVLEVTTFGLVGETTPRVFRKPMTLVETIPEPEPIAQTSDGSVMIMTATDGGQSETFTFSHEWKLGGSGLHCGEPTGGRFAINSVKAVYGDGEFEYSALEYESSADKTVMKLRKMPDGMEIPAGTYPDAKIRLGAFNGTTAEFLDVSVNLVAEA